MAKRPAETLDDLLADAIQSRATTAFAARAGISPFTLLKLRSGQTSRVHLATINGIAKALGVDPARVRAAIEASRAAAK
jgi:DNA-binding Xre family transcriptional regulator